MSDGVGGSYRLNPDGSKTLLERTFDPNDYATGSAPQTPEAAAETTEDPEQEGE